MTKHYILVEVEDYQSEKAVLHSTNKSKLVKLENGLNECLKHVDSSIINVDFDEQCKYEKYGKLYLKSFNMYADRYVIKEIESI